MRHVRRQVKIPDSPLVINLCSPSGIGKTSVTIVICHHLVKHTTIRVHFASLETITIPFVASTYILNILSAKDDFQVLAALKPAFLTSPTVLVVVGADPDLTDVLDETGLPLVISHLVGPTMNRHLNILLTRRKPLDANTLSYEIEQHKVLPSENHDTTTLLSEMECEEIEVEKIVEQCAYCPLAI